MIPNNATQPNPDVAERIIAAACEAAEMEMKDTFTRDEVARLMHASGYACSLNTIGEFIRKRFIGDPDGDIWTPSHVYCLGMALESRRRWQPMPNLAHDSKKSGARQRLEMAKLAGAEVNDLDQYTLEDLLLRMAEDERRAVREANYEAVLLKLEQLGVREE